MPTNKQATIRYHALDRCFANSGRRYYIEDLIEACNEAIYEATGSDAGVKRRQVYSDITYMESEAGYRIPLERIADGRRKYFRYADPNFSIRGRGVNRAEVEQIAETAAILSRFRGLPQFGWVEEIQIRLEENFGATSSEKDLVSFEENPYLQGLSYFTEVFRAAAHERPLTITYQGFNQEEAETYVFHPWHLKQYNNRWFVLGYNAKYAGLSTLALDRIQQLERSEADFRPNTEYNFSEYFEDVIGVSFPEGAEMEQIELWIADSLWPYVRSKPIHGSQRVINRDGGGVTVALQLIINYELTAVIAEFGQRVKVLAPAHLQAKVIRQLRENLGQYE